METISNDATKVAVIGIGNMGGAMAEQLLQNEEYIVTQVRRGDDLTLLEEQDVTIIAMKPQQWGVTDELTHKRVAEQVAGHINRQGVLVWIMAGITTRRMREDLGHVGAALVRAMPTLAVDGCSLTALHSDQGALTKAQKSKVEALFAKLGEYMWLDDEDQFADYTALVGSGVGFFGQFAEELRQVAIEKHFTAEQAEKMARGALKGAAHLVTAELSAAELVRHVASAKGTTEAGLDVWRRKGVHKIIRAIIDAAAKRSRQLAKS